MSTHRATAALADQIAKRLVGRPDARTGRSFDWQDVRDECDFATMGDFPPGELDRLTDMVCRRVGVPS